eukprot:gene4970-6745_t
MQLPAGRMSDRMDRRYVLAILSGIAALAGIQMFLLEPVNVYTVLILVGVFGATANALYPIAVAHANDFAKSSEFMNVSGGLLLLYGIGTVIGPSIGGPIMQAFGPYALFGVTAGAHALITAHAILRSRLRAAIPVGERDSYSSVSSGTQTTPESLALSPRSQPPQALQPSPDAAIVSEEAAAPEVPLPRDEEEKPAKKAVHDVGADLSALSVQELAARIDLLKTEIGRLESEIAAKSSSRSVAEGLFRNGRRWRYVLGRPRLFIAVLIGILFYFVLPLAEETSTRLLLAWDIAVC